MNFKAHEGCFQIKFANGVTLSASTRFAQDGIQSEYIEVRAWDRHEMDIELPDEYSSRVDVTEYLELAKKLSHPDLMNCQDCEAEISDDDNTCPSCGEGLSHPWLLLS